MEAELKGGHLPADKVGGRRIVNKKERRQSENERTPSESSEEKDVAVKDAIIDSNMSAQLEKAYPTSGVRASHDKPIPRHQQQYAPPHGHVMTSTHQVFQPKKGN